MDTIVGVLIGGFLALSGSYLIHHLETTRSEKQERRRLYTQLMGLRSALHQHAGLQGDVAINYQYYEAMAGITTDESRHTYYDQKRQFWQDKTIEATTALVESHMRLMETIGGIHMHFDRTDELDSLSQRLFDVEFLKIETVENVTAVHLKALRKDWEHSLNSHLTNSITKPIDALARYLRDQLADD